MKKLLCATLVVIALLVLPATSALAADPVIEQPTASVCLDSSKVCSILGVVEVEGLSVELETIWGTNGTSIISVTGPVIKVIEVPLFHPVVDFDDPIVGIDHFDDPIVG